ncbi:MAG: RsmB/NOP family class I SAM-dependent RNA methyltransferase [Bacilli bacterium]
MIPEFLIELLTNQYGKDLTKEIIKGYNQKRNTTLRVNTTKTTKENIKNILDKENIKYEDVSWYEDALILEDEKHIRKLDIYENGEIYMQSLSSMIPPIVLEPKREKILDMAASPGGKTTEIYNLSNKEALITAVEKNPIRADRLKYNLNKQGTTATVLLSDASKLDEFFRFDKILLDAPCSGSGTLSTLDNSLNHFNKNLIKNSVETQQKLLSKALQILKQNSTMVYSTCSILYEENEAQLEQLIKQNKIEIIPIDEELFKDIPTLPTKIPGTICVLPNELYEGFFVAKIKKI